ncbi:MAG: hypothetical protein H8E42_03765 [Nitrospinae bacterium]|nr:hypothetical protein [Nitrospinota bacterium]MBL7020727.1 hypothetical protein [Nitrospinaceae bacterium]
MENRIGKLAEYAGYLLNDLELFKETSLIIDKNTRFKEMDLTALDWMHESAKGHLVISFGRFCDTSKGNNGLVKFLEELKKPKHKSYRSQSGFINRWKKNKAFFDE